MNNNARDETTDKPVSLNNKATPDAAVFSGAALDPTSGAAAGADAGFASGGGGGYLLQD